MTNSVLCSKQHLSGARQQLHSIQLSTDETNQYQCLNHINTNRFISTICNIYISRLCYNVSVCLSVTEVHWRIIANLGFKFWSQFTAHCGRGARGCEHWTIYSSVGTREGIIAGKSGGLCAMLVTARPSCCMYIQKTSTWNICLP